MNPDGGSAPSAPIEVQSRVHRRLDPGYARGVGERREYRDAQGRLHREDGPALEHANGSVKWYRHGKRHRVDAPACVYVNGTRKWYEDGLRHRKDGPASTYPDGRRIWFERGVKVRQERVAPGREASIRDGGES